MTHLLSEISSRAVSEVVSYVRKSSSRAVSDTLSVGLQFLELLESSSVSKFQRLGVFQNPPVFFVFLGRVVLDLSETPARAREPEVESQHVHSLSYLSVDSKKTRSERVVKTFGPMWTELLIDLLENGFKARSASS